MSKAKKTIESSSTGSRSDASTPVRAEAYDLALEQYSQGLELLRGGDYRKALDILRGVEAGNPDEPELAERARTYAAVCAQKLEQPPEAPATADDNYLLAVVRSNDGLLDEAMELINIALASDPQSARYLYTRASIYALKGRAEPSTADLRRAVEKDPQFRFQATNDPDFEKIRDEASFIDVIEPTPTGA